MKILAPVNHIADIDRIVRAGAGEVYAGYQDPAWKQRYGKYSDVNRLTLFCENANYHVLEDMKEFVYRAHDAGAQAYITLNAPGYYREQLSYLRHVVGQLAEYGADGVIVSTPELIPIVRETGMTAVASTMCGIRNTDIAGYYLEKGAGRLILPRELTTAEIESVITGCPDAEYEVFLMRNGCRYLDAACLGLHGGETGALCADIRFGEAAVFCREDAEDLREGLCDTHEKFSHAYHEYACGQCAVYRLMHAGVTAVKIVGRMDPVEEIAADVRLTAENIAIAGSCGSEAEYLSRMRLPGDPETFCRNGFSCYYPEVCRGQASGCVPER